LTLSPDPQATTGRAAGERKSSVSTKTKTQSEPDLQSIPTSKIAAVPGFNPRGEFSRDDEEFKSLKASIKERGIETPIKVGAPDDDGIYPIIFGHRRHAAAAELGLELTPAIVDSQLDEKQRYIAALVENRERADMSPEAEARALRVLREDLGLKQADAAEVMAMSERKARDREKLLDLPEPVVSLILDGTIPLEAIPHLAKIAAVRSEAVVGLVELVKSGRALHGVRLDDFGDVAVVADALGQVAGKFGLQEIHGTWGETSPGALPVTNEQRKELKALHKELPAPPYSQKPGFKFTSADKKKAKAAGALVEFEYKSRWGEKRCDAYITDGDLVFELAKKKVPAMRKGIEADRAKHADLLKQKDDRKAQQAREEKKREREAQMAEKANAEFGEALGAMQPPKATDVEVARLVCALALGSDHLYELVSEGLGQLVDRYAPPGEAHEQSADDAALDQPDGRDLILDELAAAKTPGDCYRIVLRVMMGFELKQGPTGFGWVDIPDPGASDTFPGARALLDEVAGSLVDLPKPIAKEVDRRRKERREQAEREAKAAEARAKEAEEAEQQQSSGDVVFDVVKRFPGIPATDIAKKTNLKQNAVYRILGDLEKAGRIKKKNRKYEVAEAEGE
jgi:ParB/RepB/Spo0J family partition protein